MTPATLQICPSASWRAGTWGAPPEGPAISLFEQPCDIPSATRLGRYAAKYPDAQKGADITSDVKSALGKIFDGGVAIRHPGSLWDYFTGHADMIDLVRLACAVASSHFEKDAKLFLEMYCDPEIEDEYPILIVRQRSYTEDILERIEKVWATYEDELPNKSGWFLVTTDFRLSE